MGQIRMTEGISREQVKDRIVTANERLPHRIYSIELAMMTAEDSPEQKEIIVASERVQDKIETLAAQAIKSF
jgi:uncharacterized protein YjiK